MVQQEHVSRVRLIIKPDKGLPETSHGSTNDHELSFIRTIPATDSLN